MKLFSAAIFAASAALGRAESRELQSAAQLLETRWDMSEPNITYNGTNNLFILEFNTTSNQNNINDGMNEEFYNTNCKDDGSGFTEFVLPTGVIYDPVTKGRPRWSSYNEIQFEVDTQFMATLNESFSDPPIFSDNKPSAGLAQMDFCVRTSLGYDGDGDFEASLWTQINNSTTSNFTEVNFIESLITITYNLTAGFEVLAFNVEPKIREGISVQKDSYGLEAYLCLPEDVTTWVPNPADEDNVAKYPPPLTDYDYNETNPFSEDAAAKYFNQGALITVCVRPDAAAWSDGIRMDGLTTFDWYREANITNGAGSTNNNNVPGWGAVEQNAISGGSAASNALSSYISTECVGGYEFCHFSSILFADFYAIRGFVSGAGNANLIFVAPDAAAIYPDMTARKLTEEERDARDARRLQDSGGESPFDLIVPTDITDDGPGGLRTAGGASVGLTALATIVGLLSAALLA